MTSRVGFYDSVAGRSLLLVSGPVLNWMNLQAKMMAVLEMYPISNVPPTMVRLLQCSITCVRLVQNWYKTFLGLYKICIKPAPRVNKLAGFFGLVIFKYEINLSV